MESTFTSPSGKTESCEIRGLPDDLCSIKFTPAEEGVNTISLKYKGIHFAGWFMLDLGLNTSPTSPPRQLHHRIHYLHAPVTINTPVIVVDCVVIVIIAVMVIIALLRIVTIGHYDP